MDSKSPVKEKFRYTLTIFINKISVIKIEIKADHFINHKHSLEY